MYLYILSELPVYENYKGFSDKPSYNGPIIIYSVGQRGSDDRSIIFEFLQFHLFLDQNLLSKICC